MLAPAGGLRPPPGRRPQAGPVRIVIEDGSQSWVQDVPNEADISVGRALNNTIIIEDTAASRDHCVVERNAEDAGEFWLRDRP